MADTHLLGAAIQKALQQCSTERQAGVPDSELLLRFAAHRDEVAFEALVWRHGPMVLGVCQRVLQQADDAEDCFQPTFLLLARRAGSVTRRESLGSWLHGVAYRMATNARRAASRRRTHEARATATPTPNPAWQAAWREVQAVLDEEIQRLPAAYRQVFVHCCLEGKSCAEAARDLGQKEGTVWSRIARARGMLRTRLARRGVSLALLLATGELSDNLARAALPAGLLRTTIQAAAGTPTSSAVAALVEGGIKSMIGSKIKGIATILFLAGAFAVAAGALAHQQGAGDAPAEKAPPAAKAGGREPGDAPTALDRPGDELPPGALARMGTTRFRPGKAVGRLLFSPDGKVLASGNWRMSVQFWDAVTGKEVRTLPGKQYLIGICERGNVIVTRNGRGDFDLHFWETATGKELRSLPASEFRQYTEVSPDGKALVTAAYKGKAVYLHDPEKGTEIRQLESSGVVGLVLSPDGKTVAALDQDNLDKKDTAVRLWDTATGKELRKIEAPFTVRDGDIAPLVFSPDGKTLAGALADNAIHLWDVTTGKELRLLSGHGGHVQTLAFSPDGKALASGGRDGTVRLWNVASGKEVHRMEGHSSWVQALAFAPDGRSLASGAQDNTIRRWDIATGKEIAPPQGHTYWVFSAALSPDGKLLATGAGDGTIRLWKVASGDELRKIDTAHGWVDSVAFSPDGRFLAVGQHLLQPGTVERLGEALQLWDAATGKLVRQLHREPRVEKRQGAIVIGGGKPIVVSESPGPRKVNGVGFSPDGRALISAEEDGAVVVWEVLTGQVRREFLGHQGPINGLAVSPDGRKAASVSVDLTALVWDVTGLLQRKPQPRRLSDERLGKLWDTLRGSDAAEAARAAADLAANPEQTVSFLEKKLPAVPRVDAARMDRLVADLDGEGFETREAAERELRRLGRVAEAALRKPLKGSPSAELRQRAQRLLEALSVPQVAEVGEARAVEVLEWIGTPPARRRLEEFGRGAPGAWLTEQAVGALRRLPRPDGPRH